MWAFLLEFEWGSDFQSAWVFGLVSVLEWRLEWRLELKLVSAIQLDSPMAI